MLRSSLQEAIKKMGIKITDINQDNNDVKIAKYKLDEIENLNLNNNIIYNIKNDVNNNININDEKNKKKENSKRFY